MKTVWNHKIATHLLYLAILQTKLWFCVHSCKSKIAIKHCGLKERMKSVPYVFRQFGRTVSILNSWERQSCHSHHFRFKSLLWEVFPSQRKNRFIFNCCLSIPLQDTTSIWFVWKQWFHLTSKSHTWYLTLTSTWAIWKSEKVKLQIINPCSLFGPR